MHRLQKTILVIIAVSLTLAAWLLIAERQPNTPKVPVISSYAPIVRISEGVSTVAPEAGSLPGEMVSMVEAAGYSIDDIPGSQLIIAKGSGTYIELFCFEKNFEGAWLARGEAIDGRTGSGGVTGDKIEGDMKTPAGLFLLGPAFGIKDEPETKVDYKNVTEESYWIDDPNSIVYNTWVEGTEDKDWNSAEHLADFSPQYNYALVINYNVSPIVPGAGSAIFIHCGTGATAGCISIPEEDMLGLLGWLNKESAPSILIY